MNPFPISDKLEILSVKSILTNRLPIVISKEAKERIARCRNYLNNVLSEDGVQIYGVNTGFGALRTVKIKANDYSALQENLLRSHACGTGEEVPAEIVRLMVLLKIQSLSYGHSGVTLATVDRLKDFFNHRIIPVVYQQGSLGASGDLAPLAHLCLPLIGQGEVHYKGSRVDTAKLHKIMKWKPLSLKPKEGLALLNGTQFMSAYGVWLVLEARRLCAIADTVAAMSLDAFDCRLEPFEELLHWVRPHPGQRKSARYILNLLAGSRIALNEKQDVQDPYSFRCIPQVHGAILDVVAHAESVFSIEVNSVTDNPLLFPTENKILSGGNFHGHPLAMALDYLGIALADLGNISERRTYQLLSGQRNLPRFLIKEAGINSGLMLLQYTAASLVSQNKQYASPASIDSIVSSNGQEDYVSMGANAAVKCLNILENLTTIIAIELITAAQALHFRKPAKSSPLIEDMLAEFRRTVPLIAKDRILSVDIANSRKFIEQWEPEHHL